MPKSENQKLKLFRLLEIFWRYTDESHMITTPEIIAKLESYEIIVERKTVYADIRELNKLGGFKIKKKKKGVNTYYYISDKIFSISQLKILVDASQAFKFIPEDTSEMLIKKLALFSSKYESDGLKHQVRLRGRIKTKNHVVLEVIDTLNEAITKKKIVRFKYYKWVYEDNKIQLKERHENFVYSISPRALVYNDENYYFIGIDEKIKKEKFFRVDKMKDIELVEDEKMTGANKTDTYDIVGCVNSNFDMYAAKKENVKIEFKEDVLGVIIDRFGTDIRIIDKGDGWYGTTLMNVGVANTFFGWFFIIGMSAKIVSPSHVRDKYREYLLEQLNNY
ncbi:helix-turn-helix transcriptional regulator [Lachnobacterium bovis]|uniref:helix-turn-helix transcriptional regulator n=1 Tax=Lachnobacterium bovis TaxID=140626 RepID=UPI0003B34DFE|nr:WYL domain-containing protein [Lachnobacterium bovis]